MSGYLGCSNWACCENVVEGGYFSVYEKIRFF